MIGFTLSKLNLLILVTALFAIIVFFTFTLNDAFLVQKANVQAEKLATEVNSVVASNSVCAKNRILIPADLGIYGGRKLFYVIEISKVVLEDYSDEEKLFALQFSMLKRDKKLSNIIASTRLNVKAKEIYLFSVGDYADKANYGVELLTNSLDNESVVLDPQSEAQINAFMLAKEIKEGKTNVFIVPCNALSCEAFANTAAKAVSNAASTDELFRRHLLGECLAFK